MIPRAKSHSGIYHVIIRGVNRCPIFSDENDYKVFLKYLIECREQAHFLIYCYCLMGNHVHLLINDREGSLCVFMQTLNSKYASYFNAKYERVGHLFQGRFLSKPVETREYFYKLICYILYNPEKSFGIALQDYRWSSYMDYMSGFATTDTHTVWAELGGRDGLVKLLKDYDHSDPDDCEIERRLSDDEVARVLAGITPAKANEIRSLPQQERISIVKKLLAAGATVTQIFRLTGISRTTINRYKCYN